MFPRFSNFLVVLIFFATISQTLCQNPRPKTPLATATATANSKTKPASTGQTCGKLTPVCIKGSANAVINSGIHAPVKPAGTGSKCDNGSTLNCCSSDILKIIGSNKNPQNKAYQNSGCKPATGTTAANRNSRPSRSGKP
ncbi:hypothetical protein PCANC_01200 [Puccinia coronata f. sp. avenae]|uniref:Hydrophobin n=1 Tax=Puccinia coronata f. sp. avenae TaxID=200324 RepID=A0A2N5SMJ5_9BASI|nr:hypothetical protein PCANC_15620 [Puccinia coronata f. sp. avenae]PLW14465.1 hypothetical protein PCASD_14384 [Puccinia coronata f. sp. avenae]PLW44255.1 hypothetical protein PCASD_03888 [Puccinia coronata f. sp. avenae]PLW56895.1 hypothetical protein PCANC_01200 [Puccinia coronata f. sp. avenae]